jgi:hypothetical protein
VKRLFNQNHGSSSDQTAGSVEARLPGRLSKVGYTKDATKVSNFKKMRHEKKQC